MQLFPNKDSSYSYHSRSTNEIGIKHSVIQTKDLINGFIVLNLINDNKKVVKSIIINKKKIYPKRFVSLALALYTFFPTMLTIYPISL